MKNPAHTPVVVLLFALTACPILGPKDEGTTDDAADDAASSKGGADETAGGEVCEDELARVKAELEATQAKLKECTSPK